MSDPVPVLSGADDRIKDTVINENFRQFANQFRTNIIKDEDGNAVMIVGALPDGGYGLSFSDGTTTFLTITRDGIILNDGTNDRVIIGKDAGGF